jgi:hypothetical protein
LFLVRLGRLHTLAAVLHGDRLELLVQRQLFRQRIAQSGIVIDDEYLTRVWHPWTLKVAILKLAS